MPQIGVNLQWWDQLNPVRYSSDILTGHITNNDLARRQTTLIEEHSPGSGIFRVENSRAMFDQYGYSSHGYTSGGETAWVGNPGSSEFWQFTYKGLPRTNEILVVSHKSGADTTFAPGSVIWAERGGSPWRNPQYHPAAPEYVKDGRPTSFPAGLYPGQIYRGQCNVYREANQGVHTVTTPGTGSVRISTLLMTPQIYQTINFVDGVPTNSNTFNLTSEMFDSTFPRVNVPVIVEVTASDFTNPIHDLRIIAPDPAEHTGPSSVSLYAANANDPNYLLFRQDAVRVHQPFKVLRSLQPYGTDAGIDLTDWASRPAPTQGFGTISGKGVPIEWMIQFANACDSDFWIDLPHRVTLDYCQGLAAYIRDNLKTGRKCFIACGNESWNFAFPWGLGIRYYCGKFAEDISGTTITRSGTTATAIRKTAHGLVPGNFATVTQSSDANFIGEVEVLSTPSPTTFTYAVANTGPTTATPRVDRETVSYKLDSATKVLPQASMVWQYDGSLKISVPNFLATLTAANPEISLGSISNPNTWFFRTGDMVLLSNFVQPEANGFYWLELINYGSDNGTAIFSLPPRTFQGLPTLAMGANELETHGGSIKIRQCIYNNVSRSPEAEVVVDAAMRYQSRMARKFVDEMRAIAPGKIALESSTGTFTPDQTIEKMIVELKAGDSVVPADTWMGPAPYFQARSNQASDQSALSGSLRVVSAAFFTASGGLATATFSYDHGYTSGTLLQIQNAAQSEYCGIVEITVTGARTFTYPISGTPVSPAFSLGGSPSNPGSIWISQTSTAFRELISLTRTSGTTMTAVSRGHGYQVGNVIRLAGVRPSGYMGNRTILSVTADSFTFAADEGLPDPVPIDLATVNGTGRRIYTYRSSTLDQMFVDLADYITTTLKPQLERQEAIFAREGIKHNCYEGGHHLTNTTGAVHNGILGLYNEVNDDPRFLELMDLWWDMEEEAGVELQNWFKIIGYHWDENWGLLRTMGSDSIKYQKALAYANAGPGPDPDPDPGKRYAIYLAGGRVIRLKEKVVA